jgi:hypothetical protein
MTREKAREAAAVMQAFVDGEEVQYSPKQGKGSSFWTTTDNPLWNWEHYDYRIKPAKTLRPWTADEVPLGAMLRYKGNQQSIRFLIVSNMERGIAGYNTHWPYQALLEEMEHSLDGGKTWKPCGVEEESK